MQIIESQNVGGQAAVQNRYRYDDNMANVAI